MVFPGEFKMAKELTDMTGDEFVKKILDGERDFTGIKLEEDFDLRGHEGFNDLLKYMDGTERHHELKANPVDLSHSKIYRLKAKGLDIPYLKAEGVALVNVNFNDVCLWEPNFKGAHFVEVDGSYSRMHSADFRGAKFYKSGLGSVSLESANLKGSDFEDAELSNVMMGNAFLDGANFCGAKFSYVSLESASLCSSNFSGASFYEVHLDGANLMKADLRGVDGLSWAHGLRKAHFYKTKVTESEKEVIEKALQNVQRLIVEE